MSVITITLDANADHYLADFTNAAGEVVAKVWLNNFDSLALDAAITPSDTTVFDADTLYDDIWRGTYPVEILGVFFQELRRTLGYIK